MLAFPVSWPFDTGPSGIDLTIPTEIDTDARNLSVRSLRAYDTASSRCRWMISKAVIGLSLKAVNAMRLLTHVKLNEEISILYLLL